jgi:hypothetical protein
VKRPVCWEQDQISPHQHGQAEQQAGQHRPPHAATTQDQEHRDQRNGEQQCSERLGQEVAARPDQRRVERDRGRGQHAGARAAEERGEREHGRDQRGPEGRLQRIGRGDVPVPALGGPRAQLVGECEHRRRAGRPVHRVGHRPVAVVAVTGEVAGQARVGALVDRLIPARRRGGLGPQPAADRDQQRQNGKTAPVRVPPGPHTFIIA